MFRWLTTNLRTFMLAFILALAVWVTAVTASNPDQTNTLAQPIPIEFVGQDLNLVLTGETPSTIQLSLRAPKSVWDQITVDPSSVRAVVDMTGLGAGTHTVEVSIQISVQPFRILSVLPHSISLTLEPLATRSIPISLSLSGTPAVGYQAGASTLSPNEAVISGPELLINQVASIRATLELTDARENLEESLPLGAFDVNGEPVSGVVILPPNVLVSLPVVHLGGYRDLAVKVVTVGRPASGYRLASVASFPPIVTVFSGDTGLIESLPGYVETMPLDLSGVSENIETRLALVLPADVTLVGDQSVLVQVGVAPIEGSLMVSYRPVEIFGLGKGLTAQVSPVTVDVILSGPLPALDSLQTSDIHVRVDVTGRPAGTYQLVPTISIMVGEITVESILPGTVQVIITAAGTPTPR